MLIALERVALTCTRRTPTAADVLEACALIRDALGARDAYVIQAGDPDFVRIGCSCAVSDYEITQKGYWLVWRELASTSAVTAGTFNVQDRLVSGGRPLQAARPGTHAAALLASDESASDLLIVNGAWPEGLSADQVRFLEAARAMLSPLVSHVADAGRRSRQRQQLESLASVANAFSQAAESKELLTTVATALAQSAGTDWANIVLYNDDATAVADRAINLARHSDTAAAALFRGRPASHRPSEVRVGTELARRDGCIRIPDVFAEGLVDEPDVAVIREDIPGLQRYWQRAHVLSVAIFPIASQGDTLGHVTFSSATGRAWEEPDIEFLKALVAQAATALKGLRLFHQLEESREELRRDIAERQRLERQLREQARHDPLTRMANRRAFRERLDAVIGGAAAPAEVAILFIDIDDFKEVNDSLGHEAGDCVLIEVADRIRQCVRSADVVARLGGDEFAILLSGPRAAAVATDVAGRIVAGFRQPIRLPRDEVRVGASIGIAATRGSMDGDALLRSADIAMYAAKSDGKSSYRVFDASLLSLIVERRDMGNELRRGVPGGEFQLHYQPLVELTTRNIVGLEALVRWDHPRRGLLAPGDFIPTAEESGAILPLGTWVLEEACRQAAAWQAQYPSAGTWTMAVNVSVKQLQRAAFLEELQAILRSSGIDPSRLHLEVTESVMAEDPDLMLRRLERIRALGVRIALDDFATGYSSLSLLRRMPVDLLKIDRCFVADIGTVPPERELVGVILELGRTLGITVIAEGIETQAQLARLQTLGCALGQGFYLGMPVAAAETGSLLATAARASRRAA